MRFLLASAFLPNFLFFLISSFFELGRPLVNFDYLMIALLMLTRFYWLGYAFLLIAIAVDILLLVGQVFPFVRVSDAFYLLGFLPQVSAVYQWASLGLLVLVFVIVYGFYRFRAHGKIVPLLVFINLSLFGMAIEVYGSDKSGDRFWRVADQDIVYSQVLYFYNSRSNGFVETYGLEGEPFSRTGYHSANNWLDEASPSDRILLVVNESWGVFNNPQINRALVHGLIGSAKVENFSTGELVFVGATVAGELRVSAGFEECLPNRLAAQGYSTRAIHGAVGLMYDRLYWYPRAGFQKTTFFESQEWPRRCFSFPGACDADLASVVAEEFSGAGKRFVYWLTLNTHSIYDLRDLRGVPADCAVFGLGRETESCRVFQLQSQFFDSLVQLTENQNMKGVEVVVVGDHAPPVFNRQESISNFAENKVSWLRFRIK